MTSASDSHSPTHPALHIDRVEWLSASPDAVLVRVLGQRHGALDDEAPLLLIDDGEQQRSFAAEPPELPAAEGPVDEADNAAWAASFAVPIELRPRLEQDGLILQVGPAQVQLPAAVAGAEPDAPADAAPGRVIDRGVLAERRARRAELNEQALMSRTTAAEATIRTLRSQLGNLEQRLEQTASERERLTEALGERERDLRRAKQREYAEEQLRFEADERRRVAELEATSGVAELRQLLHEAEREIKRLNTELEDVRRQLAEAHHSAEADQASVRRLRRELEERQTELVRREAELAQQEQGVSAALSQGQAAQADVQQRRAELEQRAHALEAQMAEAQRELAAEQARREMLEHELSTRPDAGSDDRAEALQAELERRAHMQAQVAGELSLLHGELEQVRASAEHQRERNDEADRLLEELGRTIGGLRVELEGLERDRQAAESIAERLRGEVDELVRELELARTEPRPDAAELALLRDQVQVRDQQLREAERTIHALGQSASELRAELAAERDRHASTEVELRARIEEERQASERRLAEAESRMREQLTAQGQRLVLQEDSSQERSEQLAQELREATDRLAERERELAEARAAAHEHAGGAGERESELERVVDELSGTASQLRVDFEREVAAMQQQMTEQVAAERERYMRELGTMEGRVDELRQQLAQAAGRLTAELESEQSARRRAEEELAGERSNAARLNEVLQELRARAQEPHAEQAPGSSAPEPGVPGPDTDAQQLESAPSAEELAEQRRREMAEALADAVQRLRSRVAARPPEEVLSEEILSEEILEPSDPTRSDAPDEPAPHGTDMKAVPPRASLDAPPAEEQPAVTDPPAAEPPQRSRTRRVRSRPRLARLFASRGAPGGRAARVDAQPPPASATPAPAAVSPASAGLALPLTLEAPADAHELALPIASPAAGPASSWLGPALKRVASQRDAQLATDLIVELLPAQGLHLDRPATYGIQVAGGGLYVVRAGGRRPSNVTQAREPADSRELEFTLTGTPETLSEIVTAAGLRRLAGVKVSGRRRASRKVIRARPVPLGLPELANAGIRVWPGLLLLALAEAIDPGWTEGERFVLAWAIQENPGALLYAVVGDGEPLGVTHRAPGPPAAAVYLSERAFLSVMAGTRLEAEENVRVSGDEQRALRFIAWAHRAQGLQAPRP